MPEQGFRDYRDYVADRKWAKDYSEYQQRYAVNPRESDKKSARLLLQALLASATRVEAPRILDIGCSTGNFLRHLRRVMPSAYLVGGDLMELVVDQCRQAPDLTGVKFELMDVFNIPLDHPFDAIVANAVNVYFEPNEYEQALTSIARALKPGGVYVAYEWVFPGTREARIVEKSSSHPNGLKFWFRSEATVLQGLKKAGFSEGEVVPFDIPIDLPRPGPNDDPHNTYTIRDGCTGRRLLYRGDLFQPWAHIVARKAG